MRIPISVKLITVTIVLLSATTGVIAHQSALRFEQISKDREEQSNRDQSRARATEVEGLLLSYLDKAKVVASLLMKDYASEEEKAKALDLTFARDKDLVAIEVVPRLPSSEPLRIVNENYLTQYKLTKNFMDTLRATQVAKGMVNTAALFDGKDGHVEIRNSTIAGGAPLLTIGFPLVKDEFGVVSHIVLAEVRLDRIQKLFTAVSERSLFLIDDRGRLLSHPDENKVLSAESLAELPIVKSALASELKQGQLGYLDKQSGEPFTAAYTKTALGVTAIALVSDRVILEAASAVKREAFYIAGRFLSVALLLVFIFSITLTTPIENLVELTGRIAKGDFATKANVSSRDEVGQLGEAFNSMIDGLLERDKVKNMFNKFHGSSVTDDLLKGNLELGGRKKLVTVFFSDVRDFTKFSEGHSPEQVVEMLNEYFQIMVAIINRHGGVVDKFIGDAIMAVWGAPNGSERDPFDAVKACLEMRQALAALNQLRESRGQVPLKIGIGLHRGDVISGTIGSMERMEYTVIGDAVNQASRIESATKAFGCDLLLSDSLAEIVQNEFIVQEAGIVEVKGKSEPLKLFKVRGFYDERRNPVVIQTEFSDFEAADGDRDKVRLAV